MDLDVEKLKTDGGPSVGVSPSEAPEPACHPKHSQEEAEGKRSSDGARKAAASLGQNKVGPEPKPSPQSSRQPSSTAAGSPKMAPCQAAAPSPDKRPQTQSDGSWCQTQLPEAVAEGSVAGPVTPALTSAVQLRGDSSPGVRRDREARRTDRHSAEFAVPRAVPAAGQGCYTAGSSASLGRHVTPYRSDMSTIGMGMAGSYGSPYSTLYTRGGLGLYGTGLHPPGGSGSATDWQMDSVIEQIEKQMAAVLEKIEGDMPSLLEQISDCPPEPPRLRSANASPATARARTAQQRSTEISPTPPPLPTSPRPGVPSLPRLAIPPPAYPPPSPPSLGEREERDGQRRVARPNQSPRAGMGRGL